MKRCRWVSSIFAVSLVLASGSTQAVLFCGLYECSGTVQYSSNSISTLTTSADGHTVASNDYVATITNPIAPGGPSAYSGSVGLGTSVVPDVASNTSVDSQARNYSETQVTTRLDYQIRLESIVPLPATTVIQFDVSGEYSLHDRFSFLGSGYSSSTAQIAMRAISLRSDGNIIYYGDLSKQISNAGPGCGRFSCDDSGTYHNLTAAYIGTVIDVSMLAESDSIAVPVMFGMLGDNASASAFVDPFFSVDASSPFASDIRFEVSPGIGNLSPAIPPIAAVPEPLAWQLLTLGLAAMLFGKAASGFASRRRFRKPSVGDYTVADVPLCAPSNGGAQQCS